MAKSMIIYGVPGGKTRFAQRIADHFGLTLVPYGDGSIYLPDGHLYTSIGEKDNDVCEQRSFQSVADEINSAIPRTQWFTPDFLPVNCGVYETDDQHPDHSERYGFQYWNGGYWGGFGLDANDAMSGFCINFKSSYQSNYWRGLSAEPIKVTE